MYACAIGMNEEDMRDFVQHLVGEIYRRELPTLHYAEDASDNPEMYTKAQAFIDTVFFLHVMGHRSSHLVASAIEMGIELDCE